MARPQQKGLEYFPFDTNFFSDRKIKRVLRTFGPKGVIIYLFLLCEIYRQEGYFIKWDSNSSFDIADGIGVGISEDLVNQVVEFCRKEKLFSEELFISDSVLTSRGIQERYKEATKRRAIDLEKYLIIDTKQDISVTETPVFVPETSKNVTKSTQIKVKESKVNKTITVEEKSSTGKHDFIDFLISDFKELFLKYRNRDYELTTIGKERKAIGSLLKAYKQKPENKDKSAEQTRIELKSFFERCLKISEDQNKWLYNNMTLPIINSKLNEIGNYIKSSAKQSKQLDLQDFKNNMINGMHLIQEIGEQR